LPKPKVIYVGEQRDEAKEPRGRQVDVKVGGTMVSVEFSPNFKDVIVGDGDETWMFALNEDGTIQGDPEKV